MVEITGEWVGPEPLSELTKIGPQLKFRVLAIGGDSLKEPLVFLERDVRIIPGSTISKQVGQPVTVHAFESCRFLGIPVSAWGGGQSPVAGDRVFGLYSGLELVRPVEELEGEKEGEQIKWETYTEEAKSAQLHAGKNVIVFVYPELAVESLHALRGLSRSKLSRLSPGREYVALLLKYDEWSDPRIRSVWPEVGHTKAPFLVVYSAERPPVRVDPFSLRPLEVRNNK